MTHDDVIIFEKIKLKKSPKTISWKKEFWNSINPSQRYKYYKVYLPSLRSASVPTLMGGTRLSSQKGKYSEIVPKQFQNFTAPLLVTVAKLSLNEEIEIVAGECLNRLILNLPPITLVEPIAVLCSNKHDNDELRNIGLTQALKLPKRFKDELKMVSK